MGGALGAASLRPARSITYTKTAHEPKVEGHPRGRERRDMQIWGE